MTYEKTVLLIVTATSFVTPFMASSLNIAIPSIGREFAVSPTVLSWVATAYILATATCLLPAGRFADLKGRSRIYTAGIFLFSTATLLCGVASSAAWLIFLRMLQGIGAAFIFSTGMAILAAAYPPESRGRALGYSTASTYVGLSAGPVLGGLISFHFGWRIIFGLSAFLGFLVFFLAYRFLRRETGNSGEQFDTVGCCLYMAGLVSSLYGFSFLLDGWMPRALLAAGIALLILFFRYENRRIHPLLDIHLFTDNVTFAFSNLAAMINYSATFAIGFLASLHLQVVMGLDARAAGWVMLSQPALMAIFSPFAGRLSDRVEPRIVASSGMAMTTIGLFFYIFVTRTTTLPVIIAELSLIGLGFAIFSSPNNNAIMGSVGKEKYGTAASSLATMRMVGQAISMSIVALIMAMNGGRQAIGADSVSMLLASTRYVLIAFTALSMAGIYFSLKRGRIR